MKADANPGVNNVAYTTPNHLGTFVVRCSELCGLWHGAMANYGKVVSASAFTSWAQQTQTQLASLTKTLPPYAMTYDPSLLPSLGKVLVQLGLSGAGGGYYNPNHPSSHDPAEGSEVTHMAIEIQPESVQHPGGREPSGIPKARPWWMRPAVHTALLGAVVGYLVGHWLGSFLAGGYQQSATADDNDFSIVLGYAFGVLGWLIGLGVFNDVVRQMLGRPVTGTEGVGDGPGKYFRYSLDHKVVGPKMLGIKLNERLGKIHFWIMFIFFNSTFLPLFAVGELGQPRRVFEYAANLQTLNDWVSISAFLLGASIFVFLINFVLSTVVWRERETGNPWRARGLEWQVSSPPPPHNFVHIPVVLSGPYEYGDPKALPVADLNPPAGVISGALASAGSEA